MYKRVRTCIALQFSSSTYIMRALPTVGTCQKISSTSCADFCTKNLPTRQGAKDTPAAPTAGGTPGASCWHNQYHLARSLPHVEPSCGPCVRLNCWKLKLGESASTMTPWFSHPMNGANSVARMTQLHDYSKDEEDRSSSMTMPYRALE